jgi:transcription antitermination factor NusG
VGDLRDELTWVTIELDRTGEAKALDGTLEGTLRRDLRVEDDHPIFIPVTLFQRDGRIIPIHLMEGYVFVASGLDEVVYFSLERQHYVNQVMSSRTGKHRMRCLSVISHAQVEAMRLKLREMVTADIPLDAVVSVLDGPYRGLEGRVTGLGEENAYVRITLRSLEVVATVPRVFLEEKADD